MKKYQSKCSPHNESLWVNTEGEKLEIREFLCSEDERQTIVYDFEDPIETARFRFESLSKREDESEMQKGNWVPLIGALLGMMGTVLSFSPPPSDVGTLSFIPYGIACLGGVIFLKGLILTHEQEEDDA